MAKNYIADGNTVDLVAATTIAAGDLVIAGTLVGVALDDIASGATGVVRVSGVFEVDKQASLAVAQGEKLYCDVTGGELDKTSSSQTLAGRAFAPSATSDTTVQVMLNV